MASYVAMSLCNSGEDKLLDWLRQLEEKEKKEESRMEAEQREKLEEPFPADMANSTDEKETRYDERNRV